MTASRSVDRPLMMQVIVDGLLVQYRTWGTGKKVVLMIHGWGDSSLTFDELARRFSHRYMVVGLDLPGFGGSEMPGDGLNINDYSTFVGHFSDKLGLKPEIVIGHSNGGTIAVHGLANGYFHTKYLILLASAGIRKVGNPKKLLFRALAKPPKILLKVLPKTKQDRIKKKIYGVIGSDFYRMEHMRETFKNVVKYDIRDDAKDIHVPTLLLYGDADRSTPVTYGALLASALPDAKLIVLERAGHFIHHDQVALVEEQVLEFVK